MYRAHTNQTPTLQVKHRLNSFLENERKLSSHDYFLVLFIKIDKVVTIYSKFRFDYHKGKTTGHGKCTLTPKRPLFSSPVSF